MKKASKGKELASQLSKGQIGWKELDAQIVKLSRRELELFAASLVGYIVARQDIDKITKSR